MQLRLPQITTLQLVQFVQDGVQRATKAVSEGLILIPDERGWSLDFTPLFSLR